MSAFSRFFVSSHNEQSSAAGFDSEIAGRKARAVVPIVFEEVIIFPVSSVVKPIGSFRPSAPSRPF